MNSTKAAEASLVLEPSWEPPYGLLSLLVEGLFVIAFLVRLRDTAAHSTVPRLLHRADSEPVSLGRGRAKRR